MGEARGSGTREAGGGRASVSLLGGGGRGCGAAGGGGADGFLLARLGDPEHRRAVLALDQLAPHFVRDGENLAAAEVRTDQLNRHNALSLPSYRPPTEPP